MRIEKEKLRSLAEELISSAPNGLNHDLNKEDVQRLDHELQVHQVELEMQNAELRMARDEMETALEKYIDLYDFAPYGYFTLDRNGAITAVNLSGASLLGVERPRLLGLRFGDFVAEKERLFIAEFLEKAFANKGKISCELTLTQEGKSSLIVQIEAVASEAAQECRIAVIDITARKKAEENLLQANEKLKEIDHLKSKFLASMSHELRTPLNSVIGFSSVLLNEWVGPANAEQKQNLASILSSGRLLLNMITDILDVTQLEAGAITPVIEEFDLYDLLAEAEGEVATAIREKGLELRSELIHQRMRSDRRRLLQCLMNVLSNAVKFTDKGCVTVAVRIVSPTGEAPGEEMVEISIADTGISICEEDLAIIFLPFSRIVTLERIISPGTGLGLFLTRKIATEILKGDIFVSSEYGKGSSFSLRIPVRLS